jgi:Ca2+-dependent lipid-binding protein
MNYLKKQHTKLMARQLTMPSYNQAQTFLHGHLIMEIRAAKNLPDMDGWISKLVDKGDVTDPFVEVRLGQAKLVKTSVVLNSLNPKWNEFFR